MTNFQGLVDYIVVLIENGERLASFRDNNGYTIECFRLPAGQPYNRVGRFYITAPDGRRVEAGYWMDWPEAGQERDYHTKSDSERAGMECRNQATLYNPLSCQFEHYAFGSWTQNDPKGRFRSLVTAKAKLYQHLNPDALWKQFFAWADNARLCTKKEFLSLVQKARSG